MFNLENEKTALLSHQIQRETMRTDADIRNMSASRMADMQLGHQEDMMAQMRQESQFAQHQQTMAATQQAQLMNQAAAERANMASEAAQHRSNLTSESAYLGAHKVNVQAEVMKTGLDNMGQMSAMTIGGCEGNMNPAGMMTGMMMGTAVAGQMGQMMNNMGNTIHRNMAQQPAQPTPPPMPGGMTPPPMPQQQDVEVYIGINGQQYGPFRLANLQQMAQQG